jgi:Zn finger protein HypA/HybF involved in hydrogenase expression
MNCPGCRREVKIKKNQLYNCQCGAKLLAVEINKKLIVEDLSKDKEEK